MKVKFDRNTKIITFEDLTEINANDTMYQTLDVVCELSIGETLWVTFKREGIEKTYNSAELQTHDVLLTRFADAGIVSMYFPEEIISNPGTWIFQLLIRTYSNGAVAQEIGSNEADFYVAEGLPFDSENAPVNKHTIASLYQGAQQAVKDAQAIVDNANAITSFKPEVKKTETIEYGNPASVTIDMRTDTDGKTRYLDFEFYIPKGEQGPQGEQGPAGPQGPQGPQGPKGEGFSIAQTYKSVAEMKADYENKDVPKYSFVLIDTGNVNDADNAKLFVKGDTEYTLLTDLSGTQGIKGEDGKDGVDGEDGKSAYQIWLDNGNTGTETKFLDSLKGKDGKDGVDGKDGTNGKDGVDGVNGKDGKSAYEIWLEQEGNEGKSEEDFLASLKGEGISEEDFNDLVDNSTIAKTDEDNTFTGKNTFTQAVYTSLDGFETTYSTKGVSVWDTINSVEYTLLFPVVDGTLPPQTLATQEWVKENGVGGGQLPDNVVTDVLVKGESIVKDGIAKIDVQTLAAEYITVTEEDTDEYFWQNVNVLNASFPAIWVPSDSPLANAQEIYNSDGENIVSRKVNITIGDKSYVAYAVGKKGTYMLELPSAIVLGGGENSSTAAVSCEPSVVLVCEPVYNPVFFRNLYGVTKIDWGDGWIETFDDEQTEFSHEFQYRGGEAAVEIRIYGCTEIGDDAFRIINSDNNLGNQGIHTIVIKSGVNTIGANINPQYVTNNPVTVIMDRYAPPDIRIGTDYYNSFDSNVTKIVVPTKRAVDDYNEQWNWEYSSIIKSVLRNDPILYVVTGIVSTYKMKKPELTVEATYDICGFRASINDVAGIIDGTVLGTLIYRSLSFDFYQVDSTYAIANFIPTKLVDSSNGNLPSQIQIAGYDIGGTTIYVPNDGEMQFIRNVKVTKIILKEE